MCLADRPASRQKLGFAIKRSAQLCLSRQVTRTDEGPYESPLGMAVVFGWRQGVAGDQPPEIYRLLRCGSGDKIRLDATEVKRVHNSYPVAFLRMGRRWRRRWEICEVDENARQDFRVQSGHQLLCLANAAVRWE